MRLNIQALTAGICLLQLELSAATPTRDLTIGQKCENSQQCSDCLKCVNAYKDVQGKWVTICQVDANSVGDVCNNAVGTSGTCRTDGICYVSGVGQDPHMQGLLGQNIDWKGDDGGWYAILSDAADVHMSVRVTAPLPEEFPDRQLMTGVAIKYEGGHSIVIENKHPYTTQTKGCRDWFAPCLSENALHITVDGVEHQAVPMENVALPGEATMTAVNLPPECQPYGGDRIWAESYAQMVSRRRLESANKPSITEWVRTWSSTTAAPTWCDKYLGEASEEGILDYRGKHAAFRIETPAFTVRIHHGTNHQGGEALYDGRVLPELEFWQIDLHLESYNLDASSVTGMLGETMRPQLDSNGVPIMSGNDAMRGDVEDYRISGPLETDFAFFHE